MVYGCNVEKKQQGGFFRGSYYPKYLKIDLNKLQLVYGPSPAEERGTRYIRLCDITFAKIDTMKTKNGRKVLVVAQREKHKYFRFLKNDELDKLTTILSNVIKIVYDIPLYNPGFPVNLKSNHLQDGVNLTYQNIMAPKFLELEKMHYDEWLKKSNKQLGVVFSKEDSEGFYDKKKNSVKYEEGSPILDRKKKETGPVIKDFNGRPINTDNNKTSSQIHSINAGQKQVISNGKNKNMDFEDSYKVNNKKKESSEEEFQIAESKDSGKRKQNEKLNPKAFDNNADLQVQQSKLKQNNGGKKLAIANSGDSIDDDVWEI